MLKLTVASKSNSARSEWSYEQYSPFICDALILDKPQVSMLRYRR